ncbi:uncharacterized protein TNCV_4872931 [Trichonephila clavipes]|nr:uncharacterized protein TNCV_4872931 [Trichonephila clavipes]
MLPSSRVADTPRAEVRANGKKYVTRTRNIFQLNINGAQKDKLEVQNGLVRGNKYVSSGYRLIREERGKNEEANELAGRGCDLHNPCSSVLTHSKIHSLHRTKMNLTCQNLPAPHWYAAKNPGISLQYRSSRALQTALARFRSSHLRGMIFVQGVKSFFTCHCFHPASLAHLVDCWDISLRQLFKDKDLVCDIIMRIGQMDLV